MENTYARAYTEVLTLLKMLDEEEYKKIPKEEIIFYENNCDKEYTFKIDSSVPLEKQNISKKANAVLVSIFMDYFATGVQKEKVKNILNYNQLQEEKIKQEKYDYDNLFNKEKPRINEDSNTKEIMVISEHKKTWFSKLKKIILSIFKK